jgi:hypothetical protein
MQCLEEFIIEASPAISLLDLPVAKLQLMQAGDVLADIWKREQAEPKLSQNADGLWLLTIRRQGEHGKFETPYIGTEILLADTEMGLVVVLCAYHSTDTYKISRRERVAWKGQFYRYYRQEPSGDWQQLIWQQLNDETRRMVLNLPRPEWARAPGKLSSQRKPPAKMIERISYKVVRVIDGRYYSLWRPDVEYVIGQRMKQAAKPGHASGYFSWPTQEAGQEYLAGCSHLLSRGNVVTPALALIECEIGGRTIDYGNKLCSTYLMPVRVMEVRSLIETQ